MKLLDLYFQLKRLETQIEKQHQFGKDRLGSYYEPDNDTVLQDLLKSYQAALSQFLVA